jgi:hypothetical protein
MSARRPALLALIGAAAALLAPGAAAAATTVGNGCVATNVTANRTLVQLGVTNPATALAVPADGVITRLQIAGDPTFPGTIAQGFKLLRPSGGPGGFTVAEQDVLLVKGVSSFSYRLPVRAGDRLGLASGGAVFFCAGDVGSQVGFVDLDLQKGASAGFAPAANIGVPVTATIEPDTDGDGYGDETQDLCPQSVLIREACLALGLDAHAIQTRAAAEIYVAVAGPGPARLTLAGAVTIPAAVAGRPRPVKLTWSGEREANAGAFARFRLKFPAPLVTALRKKGVALPLRTRIAATNVAGLPSSFRLKLKLR